MIRLASMQIKTHSLIQEFQKWNFKLKKLIFWIFKQLSLYQNPIEKGERKILSVLYQVTFSFN